jgi:hypothetical protein
MDSTVDEVINEFGNKEKIPMNEFKSIKDPELRLRNTANVALNYWEDHGEEASLTYILRNVPEDAEKPFRVIFIEEAGKRGMLNEVM